MKPLLLLQRISLFFCFWCSASCLMPVTAQVNIEKIGHLPYPGKTLANLWGWAAPDGTEYAIVGTNEGASVVSLADPANPVEVCFYPSPDILWHEVRTWKNYCYVVIEDIEGSEGMLIFDMSTLPACSDPVYWNGANDTNFNLTMRGTHTIFIDEKGYAYLNGSTPTPETADESDVQKKGVVILDLNKDPFNPPIVGIYDDEYVHDCYVRGDTLWTSEIYNGTLGVVDIKDRANPKKIGEVTTPHVFTHNSWLTDDGKVMFTTDEKTGAYVTAYNVTDVTDIKEIDRVQAEPGKGTIPHNTYVVNKNWVVTSYYTYGVTIHDATYPDNLIEVGSFDTSPNYSGDGFNGAWGVCPYLPSGNLIISDMEEGLYILKPTYTLGAYVLGTVTDADTGLPIPNATIDWKDLKDKIQSTKSGFSGNFKTGIGTAGAYSLEISQQGYQTETVIVDAVLGKTIQVNVQLKPIPVFTHLVIDATTGKPIENAKIKIEDNDGFLYETTSNSEGKYTVYQNMTNTYQITAGKWGYITNHLANQIINVETYVINLSPGYYDDFDLDLGWTTEATSPTGLLTRAKPNPSYGQGFSLYNPEEDCSSDIGDHCFVTGNSEDGQAGGDDVDDGYVRLISPVFNLSGYKLPQINFNRWFANGGGQGSPPNDSLKIMLTNGSETKLIDFEVNDGLFEQAWHEVNINVMDFLTEHRENLQLIVEAIDFDEGHLVDAAFDKFEVIETFTGINSPQATNSTNQPLVLVVQSNVSVQLISKFNSNLTVQFFDVNGRMMQQINLQPNDQQNVNTTALPAGFYTWQAVNTLGKQQAKGKWQKF